MLGTLSLLSFLVIIGSIVFLLFGIDLVKRKKATPLHFLIFIGGAIVLLFFALFPSLLDRFGRVFGVARGADVVVYIAIIVLMYMYITLYNSHLKERYTLTKLLSHLASDDFLDQRRDYSPELLDTINTSPLSDYVFLIRVYNEKTMIGSVLDEVYAAGYRKIVCVDDGSTDDSVSVIDSKRLQYKDCLLVVVTHPINRGSGAANCTGFATIRRFSHLLQASWMVMIDGDGQMDIADMKTFHEAIVRDQGRIHVYFGSRFLGINSTSMPFVRKTVVRLGGAFTRRLYGINVTDHHCGFRIIHRDAITKITINADNWHYANELVEQVASHHIPFAEIPVYIKYTDYSLSKPHGQNSLNSISLGFQMLYQKFFFR